MPEACVTVSVSYYWVLFVFMYLVVEGLMMRGAQAEECVTVSVSVINLKTLI